MDGSPESSQSQASPAAPGKPVSARVPAANPFLKPPSRAPWGFWSTVILGLAFVFFSMCVVPTIAGSLPLDWIENVAGIRSWDLHGHSSIYQNVATTIKVAVCLPVILLMTRVQGFSLREYCNLNRPRPRSALLCLVLMAGLVWATHEFFRLAGWWKRGSYSYDYVTSGWLVLEFVGGTLMAPFVEEVFWRGFVFKGICESKAGPLAAVATTALFWAAQHTQYDLAGRAIIFILGLFLGTVRYMTHSTAVTIFLHGAYNFYIFFSILMFVEFGIKLL